MGAELAEVPSWFTTALAHPADDLFASTEGTTLHFRAWGPADAPGLVLIHGGAAHAHWWDHIAPFLCTGRRVVAIDLSGHGDSDWRTQYTLDGWVEEVRAAIAAGGVRGRPVLVGHSMGGTVALHAAARIPDLIEAVVVIDTPLGVVAPEDDAARERLAFGPHRHYRTKQDALARFRLVPDQAWRLPYVVEQVAEHSVRSVDGGWSWKFDRAVFARDSLDIARLGLLACPVTLIGAERGLLSQDMAELVRGPTGRQAPYVEIPDADHHVLLDRPLSLVSSLRTVLAD